MRDRPFGPARLALAALALAGSARAATAVTSDPSPIVLGRTPVVTLTLQLDPALAAAPGRLKVSANVGELGSPVELGGGKHRVDYAPPPTRFPRVALLSVWKEAGGPAEVELIRLPLHGATKIDATSRPGAEVRARVGEEVFGPAIAGKNGEAPISVVIPPGASHMVILAKVGGVVTERTVAVEVPPYNRLAAVVTPSARGPGFDGVARLDVHYDAPDGAPVDPAALLVRASAGALKLERADGQRLRYRWELRGAVPDEVTFHVSTVEDPASSISVALRESDELAYALRVGVRAGLTHSLGVLAGPRYGLDAWAPFRVGRLTLGLGLTAGYAGFEQTVLGPGPAPIARSELTVVPLALRLGVVPLEVGDRLALVAGAGVVGTAARLRVFDPLAPEPREELIRMAPGAVLFAGGAWTVGPGQLFGELVLSWAPLADPRFHAQSGGVGVEVGYRFDVLRGR